MTVLLVVLFALALAGTLGVLLTGLLGISRGDPARSNRLMRWRIILQAAALLLFMLLLWSLKS